MFYQLFDNIIGNPELTVTDKIIFPIIYNLDNKKRCTMSNAYLAEISGVCVNSVSTSINHLEKLNLIKVKRNGNKRVILCIADVGKSFSKCFVSIIKDKDLTQADKIILSVINNLDREGHYSTPDGSYHRIDSCVATTRYIANRCGLNEKTVRKSINHLEELGYITIEKEYHRRYIHVVRMLEALEDIKDTLDYKIRKEKAAKNGDSLTSLPKNTEHIKEKPVYKPSECFSNLKKTKYSECITYIQFYNKHNIYNNKASHKSTQDKPSLSTLADSIDRALDMILDHKKTSHNTYVHDTLIHIADTFSKKYFEKFGRYHHALSLENDGFWGVDDLDSKDCIAVRTINNLIDNNVFLNIEVEDIDKMIDRYFDTKFRKSCDYKFMHFSQPGIWKRKMYEVRRENDLMGIA